VALTPQFGIFLVPMANNPDELFQQAKIADDNGLDLLFIQDHPYQPRFFETWTLLTALAIKTKRIHLSPGVADLHVLSD
jgi:alkanesulfonate monooxygenase SsuD/methylene tetrahydromethanopterin reductase-like flavin-dependent oxidoreductase (luciferase family)